MQDEAEEGQELLGGPGYTRDTVVEIDRKADEIGEVKEREGKGRDDCDGGSILGGNSVIFPGGKMY